MYKVPRAKDPESPKSKNPREGPTKVGPHFVHKNTPPPPPPVQKSAQPQHPNPTRSAPQPRHWHSARAPTLSSSSSMTKHRLMTSSAASQHQTSSSFAVRHAPSKHRARGNRPRRAPHPRRRAGWRQGGTPGLFGGEISTPSPGTDGRPSVPCPEGRPSHAPTRQNAA